MILSIDNTATYKMGAGILGEDDDYKLAGFYFTSVSGRYNECMTDLEYTPIAFINKREMNTEFCKQPKMAIKVTPKYNVAYKANGKGIWHVTDLKYETIEEFMSESQYCVPCHLLKD